MDTLGRARQFLLHDVWDIDLASLSAERSIVVRIVRVGQLVVKGYKEDDLSVHASALTFVTLTSLVPILAVAFAILRGFGAGQDQIDSLLEWQDGMPAAFQEFIDKTMQIVNTTNFSALGWVGLGFFVLSAVLVLANVESSFNRIWGVATSRSLIRQAANYTSVLVLVPLLIGIAGTISAAMKGGSAVLPASLGWVVKNLLALTSVFTAWMAFFFLYLFVPNTRVRAMPALLSSLLGALMFLGWQKLYISLQIGVGRANLIYGTFASVPIFLAWVYVSWVIVLLGAEFAFALQNSATFQMESGADSASPRSRIIIALSVLRQAAQAMLTGQPAFDTSAFAREHRVPIRLLNSIVGMLVRGKYVAETADRPGTYVLLRTPESIRIKDLVAAIMQEGSKPEQLGMARQDAEVQALVRQFDSGVEQGLGHLTLLNLVENGKPLPPPTTP